MISKSDFTITVNKVGGRILSTRPITVKNQIEEIRSIDDIPGVNTSLKVDGATIVYNATTGQYDVKPYNNDDLLQVANLYVTRIFANNSMGNDGQVLYTNGNTVLWGNSAAITSFTYNSNNNTLTIVTNNNQTFQATVNTVNNFTITGPFLFNTIDGGSY